MPRHRCSPSPTRTTLLALTLVSGAAIAPACSSAPRRAHTPIQHAPASATAATPAPPGSAVHALARANAERALPPDPFADPNAHAHWRTANRRADFAPYASAFSPVADAPDADFIMFGELDAPARALAGTV